MQWLHFREELSEDALKLIEFTNDNIKLNETLAAILFGKECYVTLTRGRVEVGGSVVNGQVVIKVESGPLFPILKAEVVGED